MKDKDKTKAELIKELKTLRKEREKSALNDITEHEQIEGKYPSFTKDILDASPVGIFILDSDFKVVWINNTIESYFGLQREKIIGEDKKQLIKKNIQHIFEDPNEFIRKVFATYDNNTYIENFECHVLPDGKRNERWLEHWSQPIKSGLYAGGRIEHYYDITERKQAEEGTRQKTEDLALINALNDAVNRGGSLPEILQLLAREIRRIFSCYGAAGYFLSEDREYLTMQIFTLPPAMMGRVEKLIGMRIPAINIPVKAGSLYRKALQEGKPQLINDPKTIQGLIAEFIENKILKKLVPKIYSILDARSVINVPLISKGETIGLLGVYRKKPFTEVNLKRFETISGQLTSIIERKQAEERLKKTMDAAIDTMSRIIEAKDPYTSGHQHRVCQLAVPLARELGLSPDKIEGIRIASLIHDIGKIGLPAEILSKPTKLADIEFSLIKGHSQTGYDILRSIDFFYPIAQIVLQHHERLNGSGYPNNLKGDKILLEARILGVADVVEAMSSHRPYRPALGIDKALEEISKNKTILYDPKVVDKCLALFKEKGFKFE